VSETITFFAPDGSSVPFTSDHADLLWGVAGRFMPKIAFVEDETAGREGARVRRVKVPPREVAVPEFFRGTSRTDLRNQLRTIVRRLYPVPGDGRLQVVAEDGAIRELVCRYSEGLEGQETRENGGTLGLKALLVFRAAEDPFWRAQTPTVLTFTSGEPPMFFPILPLEVAPTSIFGNITISNPGDVDAWPIWTINGPASGATLTDRTTGDTIVLSTVIAAGRRIFIDTTPGIKTVKLDDGTNLYGDLDPGSSLFPLQPGTNTIAVTLIGSTDDSSIELSYRPRYLTP
jgi:phage-related protein